MRTRRTWTRATVAIAATLSFACGGDSALTGPPEVAERKLSLNHSPSAGQSAMLLIASVSGDSIFRYEVTEGGGAVLDAAVPVDHPARSFAVSETGELFMANAANIISRFLDPENTATPNGSISGANTGAPFGQLQWSDFLNGELFQAQGGGTVLRFTFDAAGNAVFNGTLAAGGNTRGLRVNPATNEVFVSNLGNTVHRFVIDAMGNATSNGVISGGGLSHSHGIAFTTWGEMLVANFGTASISRFTFDAAGNAVPNGTISGGDLAGPLDLDLSPWGELFVTNHFQVPGKVTRWVFSSQDASATAVYNGSFAIPDNLGVMRFATIAGGGGPPNSPPAITADAAAVAVYEGDTANNTGTVSDPDGDPVTLTASVGAVVDHGDGTWSWSLGTTDGPAESQMVTITAEDGAGLTSETSFPLTVHNVAPTVTTVIFQTDPVAIGGQPVSASGAFYDPAGTSDELYTCTVDYADGSGPQVGSVSGTTCVGPGHTYTAPGVYTPTVSVTDKDGAAGSLASENFMVIYDPNGGFVTGGGWIDSPPGAYVADPMLGGKANFGFVSKYKKGATVPTGNTEFQFKAGNLNFHSSSYDWLVLTGSETARFKGSGTINGQGDYRFMIWATDESLDTFRIRIWTEDGSGNETTVYDNGFDQPLGGGSIKIHKG